MSRTYLFAALIAACLFAPAPSGAISAGAATTERVSVSTAGVEANGNSFGTGATVSADGRFVAFHSAATNLDPADTDALHDVFVRDRLAGTTHLVSRAAGSTGAKGNYHSSGAKISADGRYVAFTSYASNLHPDDANAGYDAFVRDLQTNSIILVSRTNGANGVGANGNSNVDDISPDGRFVSFTSFASNLDPADSSPGQDVYVRDLQANNTILASRETGPNGAGTDSEGTWSSISADGRLIAFTSPATNLSNDDFDNTFDVFVRDSVAHTTTLVSRASGADGAAADQHSFDPELTGDGRFVAFQTGAHVIVRDLQTHLNRLVSRATGAGGSTSNDSSHQPAISPDGRYVAFSSRATNLHPDDSDNYFDAYVRDLVSDVTTLVSRASGCAKGNEDSFAYPAITNDATVVFESAASNLVAGDTNGAIDAFLVSGLVFDPPTGEDPCPEADNDGDGICDPGQASPSCTGADVGKYEWQEPAPGSIDCRNIPEDFDSFHDEDGCPERDNDGDGVYDRNDLCPGTDATAGPDGVADSGDEPLDSQGQPITTREDFDQVFDGDGCYDVSGADFDGDGYSDDDEALTIGTRPDQACGWDSWPSDLVSSGMSSDRLDIMDLGSFVVPVRRLNTSFGVPGFDQRWNLSPEIADPVIDIEDLARTITGASGHPPMFDGQRAFGKTCP